MTRTAIRTLLICTLCFAPLIALQAGEDPLAGRWEWKGPVDKEKAHTEFGIWFDRKGNALSGAYSVDDFVDGEWQGEDGNKTPFRGEIKGDTMHIEFDTMGTVPGTQEEVEYKAPEDGRKPSTATIVIKGDKLEWTRVDGDPIEGVPDKLTLARPK